MYILGIDVGTTGTKVLLLDRAGNALGKGYQGYELIHRSGGIVEQRARDWWDAVQAAVKQACASVPGAARQVAGISLSTQGASSVLVDSRYQPLCNAITWMDQRALEQKAQLQARVEPDFFYRTTGWELNVSQDACKLLWLRQNCPQDMAKAHKFLSTVEYINYQLTGNAAIDPTNAAMRQMMNVRTQQWDEKILRLIGCDRQILPDIIPSGKAIGQLTAGAAEVLGLTQGVQVFAGAHDQYCCALGSGSVQAGDIMLGTGTAWAVLGITSSPVESASRISPAPHVVEGLWGALSTIPCGGVALEWYKNNLTQLNYLQMDKKVAGRLGKDRNLMFYPYLAGIGCPDWNDRARGTLVGLELAHDEADIALAVMEGVAFQTGVLLEEYQQQGVDVRTLSVMGGATRSEPWMQVLAATLDCAIVRVGQADAASVGAGMSAAVGLGWYSDYQTAADSMVLRQPMAEPDEQLRRFFKEKYQLFKERWTLLQQIY